MFVLNMFEYFFSFFENYFLLFGIKYKCILEKYIWQVFIRVFFDASFFWRRLFHYCLQFYNF